MNIFDLYLVKISLNIICVTQSNGFPNSLIINTHTYYQYQFIIHSFSLIVYLPTTLNRLLIFFFFLIHLFCVENAEFVLFLSSFFQRKGSGSKSQKKVG